MVDRTIVYVGEKVLDTMLLQPQKNTMIGIGALAQAVIGEQAATPAVAIDGFALSPTGPASLVLNVGPGSIYAQGAVDQNAYGSLPADTSDTITQQGITFGTTSLTFVPPGTAGFATNYLIQIGLSVQDTTPVVNLYYDAANPTLDWQGPNNTSVSQPTVRQCAALIQAKAGIAASAGTQVTPAPDPGFYGVYSVTVANGATALTSANWSTVSNAPFVPATLCGMPQAIQSNKWTFAADTGTANAMVVNLSPVPSAIVAGMRITVYKGASANTTAASINVNGAGAVSIHSLNGLALNGGEMPGHSMLTFAFDGTYWQLETVAVSNFGGPLYDGDATGTNTYTIADLLPSTPPALFNRMLLKATFSNANTTSATLNIGFGANPIVFANGVSLSGGEITGQHLLSYNFPGAVWELLTPTVQATVPPPSLIHYGPDTSVVANSIIATVTPVIAAYAVGHLYNITSVANANTAGMTANICGVGTRVVANSDGSAVLSGFVQAGQSLLLMDNGTQLELVNQINRAGPFISIQPFTTSGNYTASAGCFMIRYRMWAGGGGGYGINWQHGGGGGGEYREGFAAITPGQVIAITVGLGGVGGASAATGGVSSVDTLCTAIGGSPGAGAAGGAGGTGGSGGSLSIPGTAGSNAYLGNPYFDEGGLGGASFGSPGGVNFENSTIVGFPGAGGSATQAGAKGFVIIEEFGESA